MLSADLKTFFLFPLTNVSLFPKTTKPLNIFEPRYIRMVRESIATGQPIALCFVPEDSTEIRECAGFGIPQIIEERPDGTLLVFMNGQGKAKIDLNTLELEDGLQIADGRVVLEDLFLDDQQKPSYMALSEALVRWLRTYVPDPYQREYFIRNLTGPQEVVGAFAAYLVYDPDLQYEVMEILSMTEQIKFLYRLLESGRLSHA